MDVQIEQQIQLLSRIQLAVDSQSCLCFLHGASGAGKTHIANMLAEHISGGRVIKINYRSSSDAEQFKQQLMCELATDEFSDINQPLLHAVNQHLESLKQSLIIVVDNASDLPQATIAMLWHAVSDFSRERESGFSFSVVLVGETDWAMPLFTALDKKENSLVAEFQLKPLSEQQALDFMYAIHPDWPNGKIEQFIGKLAPRYRLPTQLIYAELNSTNSRANRRLIMGLVLFSMLLLCSLLIGYLYSSSTPEVESLSVSQLKVAPQLTIEPTNSAIASPAMVSKNEIKLLLSPTLASEIDDEQELVVTLDKKKNTEVVAASPIGDIISDQVRPSESGKKSPIQDKLILQYELDEVTLLDTPSSRFSLMLGGFSQRKFIIEIAAQLQGLSEIYQYKTIRNGKPWFVLLYGRFATRAAANNEILVLPQSLSGFSPWAKPYSSIHQEIVAYAATTIDNS